MMTRSFTYKNGNNEYKFVYIDRILEQVEWHLMKKESGKWEFVKSVMMDYRNTKAEISEMAYE